MFLSWNMKTGVERNQTHNTRIVSFQNLKKDTHLMQIEMVVEPGKQV